MKLVDQEKSVPLTKSETAEFLTLLEQIELLLQPEESKDRVQALRMALATRVLRDLEQQFGEAPAKFTTLVNERWFEFLCAAFQYYIKHRQEIANAFEGRLLAKLVARSEWQNQLTGFGGESLRRIEAAQEWLKQEQREGFERIESLVTLLLPLLSFASDEVALNETLMILIRTQSERVIDVVHDEGVKIRAHADHRFNSLEGEIGRLRPQLSTPPEPLIHALPIQQDIEGREYECATILRAMSKGDRRVLAFAAPGGFGKTALLTKVVKKISGDGRTYVERVALTDGEEIDIRIGALLHIDCLSEFKLGMFFANAGKLVGQAQVCQDIYDAEGVLPDKLRDLFSRISVHGPKRVWIVFDNFQSLLDDQDELRDSELRVLFSRIFAGGHSVFALIVTRHIPKFSPREQILELETVGSRLFAGLPLNDCVEYLRKNGAARGLEGSAQEIDGVLSAFALRVHRIPLALVWAAGYLHDKCAFVDA